MKSEIIVGQIWEVVDENFYATKKITSIKTEREARFHIKKGEKIEIRYPFEWNYRCEDNFYAHSDAQYILDKCKLFGTVKSEIKYKNKANLEEILRLDLYDKA